MSTKFFTESLSGLLIASLLVTVTPSSASAQRIDVNNGERRCAFLGRFGSFTVIGTAGTAAYSLGNNKYIADLVVAGEEANWWLYRPTSGGDPATRLWAFARQPWCGKYRVMRYSNGAWREYEQTEAWGRGLGDSTTATFSAGPTNQVLLDTLRAIENKLKLIQPDQTSLTDLENLLKARP